MTATPQNIAPARQTSFQRSSSPMQRSRQSAYSGTSSPDTTYQQEEREEVRYTPAHSFLGDHVPETFSIHK
jgi:hypothetical protein